MELWIPTPFRIGKPTHYNLCVESSVRGLPSSVLSLVHYPFTFSWNSLWAGPTCLVKDWPAFTTNILFLKLMFLLSSNGT